MTEIFFPQRETLRLDAQNLTPRARRKAVYAGGNEKSHSVGAKSLQELAEWKLNATRVSELTVQAGREMKERQTTMVEEHHRREAERLLTASREVSPEAPANLPQVGVVEMDGGRIRTRAENSPRGVTNPHWREFQAGCVVRLQSEESSEDPRPDVPPLFLNRPKVQKLVTQLHRQKKAVSEGSQETTDNASIGEILAEEGLVLNASDQPTDEDVKSPKRPVRLQRTCVATLQGADACGRILAAESAKRGLDQAPRKGFLGDGQTSIWSVWELYFKSRGYLAILDFIHLLSYVYGIAMAIGSNADDAWQRYVDWITALWNGDAKDVLNQWRVVAKEYEIPENQALPDNDPRRPIQRAVTYLENNLQRVDYPRYRRLGLPVTSTLMESLVKEFNMRVKGTEKFWSDPEGCESILTVRAALLSEDDRFSEFFDCRTGCCYRRRSTLYNEQAMQAAAA